MYSCCLPRTRDDTSYLPTLTLLITVRSGHVCSMDYGGMMLNEPCQSANHRRSAVWDQPRLDPVADDRYSLITSSAVCNTEQCSTEHCPGVRVCQSSVRDRYSILYLLLNIYICTPYSVLMIDKDQQEQ